MSIQIIWPPLAFNRMGDLIREYPERKAEFAASLKGLSLLLVPNPEQTGESREPPYRVTICGQLTFWFRPVLDEGRVYVVWVHLRETRR